jgi:hypothetical protein
VNPFVRSDLHVHEYFYCGRCRSTVQVEGFPIRCERCGDAAKKRYLLALAPTPTFAMGVEIKRGGRTMQKAKLGPSPSADGSIATVFQEVDRRDEDKSQHRYRKKVVRADGLVIKDVDVLLSNQAGHGNAGILHDPVSRDPPGDPLHVKLDFKPPRLSRRAFDE